LFGPGCSNALTEAYNIRRFLRSGSTPRARNQGVPPEALMEEGEVSKRKETRNIDDVALSTEIHLSIPLLWRYTAE
jgi:hypothetical protein